MNNQTTMTKVKDCKHSTPYKASNVDAPVQTIYITKPHKLATGQSVMQTWTADTVTFSVGA